MFIPASSADRGDDRERDRGADEGDDPVADDQRAAVRGRQQQPAAEAELEVGRDREAGEDAAEGGRLQQHEAVLEGGVARRVVEAGLLAIAERPPAKATKKKIGISSGGRNSAGLVRNLSSRRRASPPATEK